MTVEEFRPIVAYLEAQWYADEAPEETFELMGSELARFEASHVMAAVLSIAREGRAHLPTAGQIRKRIEELVMDAPDWPSALRMLEDALLRHESWRGPERCLVGNDDCDGLGTGTRMEPYGMNVVDQRELVRLARVELGVTELESLDRERLLPAFRRAAEILRERDAARPPFMAEVAYRCGCAPQVRELHAKHMGIHPFLLGFVRVVGWPEIEKLREGNRNVEAQLREKYVAYQEGRLRSQTLADLSVGVGLPAVDRARAEAGLEMLGEGVRRALPEQAAA